MVAAVYSGGGASGISSVATSTKLNREYQLVAGTSTGALESSLILLQRYDVLKEAYSNVDNNSIFSTSPYTKKNKISILNFVWRYFTNQPSIGESDNLRKLIDKFLTEDDFNQIRALGKEGIVGVQEVRQYPASILHKSTNECSYEEYKKWVWVSANCPMLMSVLCEDDREYIDGGLTELLPIRPVLERGFKEVDVFIHRVREKAYDRGPSKEPVHSLIRYVQIMREFIERSNLEDGIRMAEQLGVKLNVYWLPKEVSGNFMVFDKATMRRWYDVSYETALDEDRVDRYDFSRKEQK
jgi:predicted acylesterase/phospholipase RssA